MAAFRRLIRNIDKERLLAFCDVPRSKAEIQAYLGIKSESYTRQKILLPLLESGELVRTIPEKPKSINQKYISSRADQERKLIIHKLF